MSSGLYDLKEVKKIVYNATQEQFIRAGAPRFQAFFGGIGNGKTMALCAKADMLSRAYPGNRGLIGRLDFADLRQSTLKSYFELRPDLRALYKENTHTLTYPNGSEVMFRELKDISGLLSMNLGFFGIDQAEEVGEDAFLTLVGRLRHKAAPVQLGFMVGNPAGHDWIWRRFKAKNLGKGYNPQDYLLIEATSHENAHNLPPGYIESILANAPEHWVKRYVYGSWDSFEGLIWPEFNEHRHVIDPIEIPDEWAKIRCIDHGYTNPTACLWLAVDQDGVLYCYREHYQSGQTISEHAKAILDSEPDYGGMTLIDPSCMAKNREKNGIICSIADEYAEHGILAMPANNDVRGGINKVAEYFKAGRIKIFKDCRNLIRELGDYQWRELKGKMVGLKNAPEEPRKVNDHLCLAGEARVYTARGWREIRTIRIGDSVLTRGGWRSVTAHAMTRKNAEIVRVDMSNGEVIRATPDHRLFLENGRKVFVDSLGYGDRLWAWSPSSTEAEPTFYTQGSGICDVVRDTFTGTYGKRSVAQSRKGIMSTTARAVDSTTPLKILNASQEGIISPNTHEQGPSDRRTLNTLPASALSRLRGIARKLVELGTGSMGKFFGRTSNPSRERATDAMPSTSTPLGADASVATSARPRSEGIPVLTTRTGSVLHAGKPSGLTDTRRKSPATSLAVGVSVIAVEPAGRADVYNITVEGEHEYFVEGVLSANCDTLRYSVMSQSFYRPARGDYGYEPEAATERGISGYGI